MNELRKLPIGIQSFEKLIEGGYLYVDKTEYVWNLVNTGETYFLSRPRRFGKSLFTSTIAAYFQGKKKLFKGLAIEKHENEKGKNAWQTYPVIYFSLASGEFLNENGLRETLEMILEKYEKSYGVPSPNLNVSNRFRTDIENIYQKTGKQVVVLVDEYDKPLLETMGVNAVQEKKNRELYKSFFSALKDEDQYLKFVFITGVTKFSKVSIFSDLNQLNDISMDDQFSALCGITEEELLHTFEPEIKKMAEVNGQTEEETVKELQRMYDGYHFSKNGPGIYNPFSILNAFFKNDYGSYWYSTGTPTFLVHSLEYSSYTVEQFTDGVEAKESEISDYRAHNVDTIPLFYQSGYLTVVGYNRRFRKYKLSFPNDEVRYGFLESLMPEVLGNKDTQHSFILNRMVEDLDSGKIDEFMRHLESIFAGIPYLAGDRPPYEQEWRNEIYLILALMGENIQCEVHTASGRADCIVETDRFIYIFEYKLDQSPDVALIQIDEKGYALPYQSDTRNIYRIGVSFSSEKRNIGTWKTVPDQR